MLWCWPPWHASPSTLNACACMCNLRDLLGVAAIVVRLVRCVKGKLADTVSRLSIAIGSYVLLVPADR